MKWFEEKVMPALIAVGNNKHLCAIRDGVSITIPFTIIGSAFLIIANFPSESWMSFIEPWSGILNAPANVTFGTLGLVSACGVGYYLAGVLSIDRITTSLLSATCFLISTLTQEWGINIDMLGASGMFTAIVISMFVGHTFKWCINRNFIISLPDGVPPSVSMSFTALIPGAITISGVWVLRCLANININDVISTVISPLLIGMGTLPGMLLYVFLVCMLWVCGIHGDNVLSGIATPIFFNLFAQNTAALQAGVEPPNIFAGGFWIIFLCYGGTGSTLGLVLNMLRSKCKMYRDLGKLALPSAIFCINEPVIFGFPIVANPLMMIPFILTPMILCIGTYLLMSFGLVGKIVAQTPWTTPPIISAYLSCGGNIGAAVWAAISIVICYLMYLPFFKIAERKQLEIERQDAEQS